MKPATARPARALKGDISVPGDKSVSHRALILGALSVGETRIEGLLEAEDVLRTRAAVAALGAKVLRTGPGAYQVHGRGVGGLAEPDRVLDLGNSGTGVRLLAGAVATQDITVMFTGDESLCRRPMGRIMEPLAMMGARFMAREGGRLPMAVHGSAEPMPLDYTPPVASAQVKSAILLAGLNAPGETCVTEPAPTRDHTERMLRAFGAGIVTEETDGCRTVRLSGYPELRPAPVHVPADPSSAAFPLVAALLVPGSEVRVEGVGLNPLRAGLFETLVEMGAALTVENGRDAAGEPVADLVARGGALSGVTVPASRAPSMIDEYPVLAAAAACATGETRFEGVGELRAKESDRLDAVAEGLRRCGVHAEAGEDWLAIEGAGGPPPGTGPGGPAVETHLDHRIAMSFLVLGLASRQGVAVDDTRMIETSFPGFQETMERLGAEIA